MEAAATVAAGPKPLEGQEDEAPVVPDAEDELVAAVAGRAWLERLAGSLEQ